MKVTLALAALATAALATTEPRGNHGGGHDGGHGGGHDDHHNQWWNHKPKVTSRKLEADISEKALLKGAQKLQDFAYKYPPRNRLMGGAAHNDTIKWLKKELESTGYYDVSLQPFANFVMVNGTINEFTIGGKAIESVLYEYSNSTAGRVSAPLVPVANFGCEAADYPANVAGNIALISRGTCQFGLKSAYAGAAGAAGAIIYNNVGGDLNGGLGPPRPEGPYVATVYMSQEEGLAYLAQIQGGATVNATLDVLTYVEWTGTANVIATTKGGDKNNRLALGAHTDSVGPGPGINDDGSGTIGILNVAKALAKYSVKNAVTFGFWSGEEEDLLGSTHFVETLSPEESLKIRAYLNFDMIASPNFVHQIYDGDGSAYGLAGPAGSAELEAFFEKYFTRVGAPYNATEFSGRSDYGPFLDANIPAGGTTTGADEVKTEEEAAIWGGTAGEILDQNYHKAGDTVANLNSKAWLLHARGIAAGVAKYATSWEGFPARTAAAPAKRSFREIRRSSTSGKRSIKLV